MLKILVCVKQVPDVNLVKIDPVTGSLIRDGVPAIMNPPELYKTVRKAVGFFELVEPSMITEDFAWYQKVLPGMFFFLGAGNTPALHADDFTFNEEILQKGADFFEELAKTFP